jgi:hypothetical protein
MCAQRPAGLVPAIGDLRLAEDRLQIGSGLLIIVADKVARSLPPDFAVTCYRKGRTQHICIKNTAYMLKIVKVS